MTWTYGNSPGTTTAAEKRDAVRFLSGDTKSERQRLSDEEIQFLVDTEDNVYIAAAVACENLAQRYGGVRSKSVGSLSITFADSEDFRRRSVLLRSRGAAHMVITAGGVKIADRDSMNANADLIRPDFEKGMHDNPEGGRHLDPDWECH